MNIQIDEFNLQLVKGFLPDTEATACFATLLKELNWQQESIVIFGKERLSPRLQCFYGDTGVNYRYSGRKFCASPWPASLKQINTEIQERFNLRFNGVLCNLYRDGQDSMGWHSDNEPELGENAIIASYSLGATRTLNFRRIKETKQCLQIPLEHNDLLIMPAGFQNHFQHGINKSSRLITDRINLTFRHFIY